MNIILGSNCSVLTYHSQNVGGDRSPVNDHEALQHDLETLTRAGVEVISLDRLIDWLAGQSLQTDRGNAVCLTFDDGCDLDVVDIDYPDAGLQRSFLGILEDFVSHHGTGSQPGLHATSFVISSEEARRVIDAGSLFGHGWMSDDWWREAAVSPLLSIGNHSWDHNHPDLDPADPSRGDFSSVNSRDQCRQQVIRSAEFIMEKTGTWPAMFAYPFGESSAYIREEFFPRYCEQHRCRAAFGTDPGHVTQQSNRWNLPRYVCGRDWRSSEELLELLVSV